MYFIVLYDDVHECRTIKGEKINADIHFKGIQVDIQE